jgi:hypothetical protein
MGKLNKGLQMILANASYFDDFKKLKYPMIPDEKYRERIVHEIREILEAEILDQAAKERVTLWLLEIQES